LSAVTIGCIGCGNMGAAIMQGASALGDVDLVAFDIDKAKVEALAQNPRIKPVTSTRELAQVADYILLAVKPQHCDALLQALAPHLRPSHTLISIAAGIRIARLKTFSDHACPVVRVMPNTPALVQHGVYALCFEDPELGAERMVFLRNLFASLGQTHELAEKDFDAYTAVIGSGPAYVFYVMEALIEAAVALGLPRPSATEMVKGLFSGSARLAQETPLHLSLLREMVTSPAGTTIAATTLLDERAVRGAIISAVRAACVRSRELG